MRNERVGVESRAHGLSAKKSPRADWTAGPAAGAESVNSHSRKKEGTVGALPSRGPPIHPATGGRAVPVRKGSAPTRNTSHQRSCWLRATKYPTMGYKERSGGDAPVGPWGDTRQALEQRGGTGAKHDTTQGGGGEKRGLTVEHPPSTPKPPRITVPLRRGSTGQRRRTSFQAPGPGPANSAGKRLVDSRESSGARSPREQNMNPGGGEARGGSGQESAHVPT